jgi:hypothetical protein
MRYGFAHPDMPIIVDGGLGLAWPWAWYLRDLPNVSYPSGEAVSAAATPGALLLVLPDVGDTRGAEGTPGRGLPPPLVVPRGRVSRASLLRHSATASLG